jgi:hypothetical protein
MPLTNSQVNKVGDRLRAGPVTDEDLRLLDEFQQEFTPALAETRRLLEEALSRFLVREQAGRPPGSSSFARSSRSSTACLLASTSFRMLSACALWFRTFGRRTTFGQRWIQGPSGGFATTRIDAPHGYRAVHAIRREGRYRVEVQLRTPRQQWWADLVELLDRFVPGLKYGTGPLEAQDAVAILGRQIAAIEAAVAAGDSEEEQRLSRELLFGAAVTAFILSLRSTRSQ